MKEEDRRAPSEIDIKKTKAKLHKPYLNIKEIYIKYTFIVDL